MLYTLLKYYVRLAMKVYCRELKVTPRSVTQVKGPVLLACNHPNSFLDAIILDILFEQPIHSLARGDAFKNKTISKILRALKILPVYRTSEGVENLSHNYKTFKACQDLFRKNGLVLIFSEGLCENEWKLRPLKKGTARLAIQSWEENIPLTVLPVGMNYSAFRKFGKNVHVYFGNTISREQIDWSNPEGAQLLQFNQLLKAELEKLVYQFDLNDTTALKKKMEVPINPVVKNLLRPFALLGYVLHWPVYRMMYRMIYPKLGHTVHFDSVLFGGLLIAYPIYLILLTLVLFLLTQSAWCLLLPVVAPCLAWALVRVKEQFDPEPAAATNHFF